LRVLAEPLRNRSESMKQAPSRLAFNVSLSLGKLMLDAVTYLHLNTLEFGRKTSVRLGVQFGQIPKRSSNALFQD
jgi:hypothetical protein